MESKAKVRKRVLKNYLSRKAKARTYRLIDTGFVKERQLNENCDSSAEIRTFRRKRETEYDRSFQFRVSHVID